MYQGSGGGGKVTGKPPATHVRHAAQAAAGGAYFHPARAAPLSRGQLRHALTSGFDPMHHLPSFYGVNFLDRFAGDLGNAAIYGIPATVIGMRHPIRMAKVMPRAFVQSFKDWRTHPGYAALNASALVGAGAGAAARLGAMGRAGTVGEAARAALLPRPGEVAKLRVNGMTVEKPLSRNALVKSYQKNRYRAKQQLLDTRPQNLPQGIMRHRAAGTVGTRLRVQRRLEQAHAQGDVHYVYRVTRHLNAAEHAAMRVVAIEGHAALEHPAEVVARHIKTHENFIAAGEDAATHNGIIKDLRLAKPVLMNPSLRFRRAVQATRELSQHGEHESIARGYLDPAAAERRKMAVAQIYSGKLNESPAGSFYFPLGITRRKGGLGRFYNPQLGETGIGKPQAYRYAPELKKFFSGKSVRRGLIPQNVPRAVQESYQRRLTLHSAHDLYNTLRDASTATQETATQVPIRASTAISNELKQLLAAADENVDLSPEARHVLSQELKRLGEQMLPEKGSLVGADLKGVRWVERGFVKDMAQGAPGKNPFGMLADAITVPVRSGTLYLRPAYALNALGNAAMLAPEGPMAAHAMWRSARSVDYHGMRNTAWMDSMMGHGRAIAQAAGTRLLHQVPEKLAEAWNTATDLHMRRAAFILEARRAGYKTPEDISRLREDPALASDRNAIAERARTIIGDYENLGPVEKNIIRRIIYFYPWLKVATNWTGHMLREHPVQSAIIANNGKIEAEHVKKVLGLLPEWAHLAGVIPAGKPHGAMGDLVPTRNPSSVNTPSSVAQLVGSGYGAARSIIGLKQKGGAGLSDLLTPAAETLATAAGQSSDTGQPTGLLGVVESLPQVQAARRGGLWGKPSKTYPGTGLGAEFGPLAAGGLYRRDVSRQALQKQAAKEGRIKPGEEATLNFLHKVHEADIGTPPHQAVEEAGLNAELSHELSVHATSGGHLDYKKAAEITAKAFDKRYGTNMVRSIPSLTTQGAAEQFYHSLRLNLYPHYRAWDNALQKVLDAKYAASG